MKVFLTLMQTLIFLAFSFGHFYCQYDSYLPRIHSVKYVKLIKCDSIELHFTLAVYGGLCKKYKNKIKPTAGS